jgi:hypothetical protein
VSSIFRVRGAEGAERDSSGGQDEQNLAKRCAPAGVAERSGTNSLMEKTFLLMKMRKSTRDLINLTSPIRRSIAQFSQGK